MVPDEFQLAWQNQSARTRITIDADLLLNEVQRSRENFRMTILFRDFTEAGIALLMIPCWIIAGIVFSLPWSWYLLVPGLIFVSGFIILDRRRHPQKPSEPGEPLVNSVKESLRQVEHQIWLLRNVLWWYLMPFAIPILIFFAHSAWLISDKNWLIAIGVATPFFVFLFALYGFLYYINQRAVRKQLEPRRHELANLLHSISDESTDGVPVMTHTEHAACSPRRMIFAGVAFLAILFIGVPAILYGAMRLETGPDDDYPKRSPFAAVRWDGSQPEVQLGDEWFRLVSIDAIPATDIVAFTKVTFPAKWQKRFEEDLVEVLTRMGHAPGEEVTLVVQSLASGETRTVEDVPMTPENRQAIREAAQAREIREQPQTEQDIAPTQFEEIPLMDLVVSQRQEMKLIGLAAMVMVDGEVVDAAADGERKKGSGVPIEISDRWHIGSITKSVTATMIARLVEAGTLQWDDTVGDHFPGVHDGWKPVTLRQLLTHTAGAPPNFSLGVRLKQPALGAESTRARREAIMDIMANKPAGQPGGQLAYSNVGYSIAGAMAEEATGEPWSALVESEVFNPLALSGAGFGPPRSSDDLEQPRGHRKSFLWKVAVNDKADNTFIMGPAGLAHMTLEDLCTYATEHMRGHLGSGTLLSAETYSLLHTPVRDGYAFGWVQNHPRWKAPQTVYWHNGSNTMWYALIAFIPEKNLVVAITSNDGDIPKAEAAAWEIVQAAAK